MIRIGINKKGKLVVDFNYSKELVDLMHELPSRAFNKDTKYWEVPLIDLPILRDVLQPYVTKHGIKPQLTDGARESYLALTRRYKEISDLAQLKDCDYKPKGLKKSVKLYPFQKVGAQFLEESKKGLLAMDMGLGKAQDLDSELLTPSGWVKMRGIKSGSLIFGSDGEPHIVTGVFPQGKKDVYEVEFSDGSKTRCSDEHLWNIISPSQKWKNRKYKTMELKDFKDDLYDKNGNKKWFIPMVEPLQFENRNLIINPYVLGALIGDGGLGTKNSVHFSSADKFLVDEIDRNLPENLFLNKHGKYDYRIVKKFYDTPSIVKKIKELKLNVLSNKKHIPDVYKFSSVEQRTAMLQGLMDTDGGVDTKDGIVITYTSVSEKLVDDIRFLVESLGGNAKKSSRIPKYTYNGEKRNGQRAYRLNISLPPSIVPFRLPRKIKKYRPRTKYQPYRAFKKVTYLGKKKCQCISIDSQDHLYVTDHCILTHNTITSLAAASKLMKDKKVKKPLIICPSTLKFNWAIEIAKFSNYSYNIIGGIAKDRKKQYKNDSDFTIMNYDLLRYDIKEVRKVKWDLIIADEIQRAKNYTTATSQNIRTLHPEYVFGLTGTPIENSIMDLFTIMRFINLEMFGGNGMYFKQRYCHVDGWGKIMEYRNDRHHEVDRKTSYFMMRRKKRDVLDDLPEKTVSYHYVTLNDQERRVYQDYKTRPAEKGIDVLAQIVYLREICDSINLVEPAEEIVSSKLAELNSILPELPEDSKVVIFTEYERMAQIIEDNIPYQSVHLHGGVKNECRLEKEVEKDVKKKNKGVKGKELDLKIHAEKQKAICKNCPYYNDDEACNSRKKIMSKFTDDPDVKVFISTNAGKEGINLQAANVVINYDMSFNPAVNEQRIARIDRIGQKSENILVINMVCLDTIEERMQTTLEEKQDLFNKVIDKTERDTLNRLGIEELTKLM